MLSKIRPSPLTLLCSMYVVVGIDLGSGMVVHTALVTLQCALSVSDPQLFCNLKFVNTYKLRRFEFLAATNHTMVQ